MKYYIMKQKGLLAIAILFSTIFSIGSTIVALILKKVIDVAISQDLIQFILIIKQSIILFVLLGLSYFLYALFSKKFICIVSRMLRSAIFNGILKRNVSDFKSVNSADYLSALTNDVKNIEDNYLLPLLLCFQNIIIFLASIVVMIYLSPMVLLCLFIAVIFLIVLPSFFQKSMQNKQDAFSKKQSGFTVAVKDYLSGFEVIRSYQMNSYITKSFGKKNNTLSNSKYAFDKIVSAVEALSTVLGILVQCSVLFMSAYLIITGKITAGSLVALVQISGTIVAPIQILSQNIPLIKGCKPIIERLNSFTNYQDNSFCGTEHPTFDHTITIQDLQFGYHEEQQVLNGINYSFKRGGKYAIIGKSGCGKTTFIDLLNGYYANYKGNILYDGIDIRDLDKEKLNAMSSIIHQNVYMFDESLKDNICLHKNISSAALNKAVNISGVSLFLGEEKTLDTSVGENGSSLSGGQRQRVAVARALVQEKPILVLDEGTSAVDMQTAYDIERMLLEIKDLTVITITHSLNPELLAKYDQIIFMDNGVVSESGTYGELMEKKALFVDFVNLKK